MVSNVRETDKYKSIYLISWCGIDPLLLDWFVFCFVIGKENWKGAARVHKIPHILVTAHTSLGSPGNPWADAAKPQLLADPVVSEIAKKHNKNTAQVHNTSRTITP